MSMFEVEKPDIFGRDPITIVEKIAEVQQRIDVAWMQVWAIIHKRDRCLVREQALMQARINKLEQYIQEQKRTKKSERNNTEVVMARQSIETLKRWLQ